MDLRPAWRGDLARSPLVRLWIIILFVYHSAQTRSTGSTSYLSSKGRCGGPSSLNSLN